MTDQTAIPTVDPDALFPKSPKEIADEFLKHFQDDVEKAERSLGTARKNLREAITLRDDAELNLARAIENEKRDKTTESTAEEEVEDGYAIAAPPKQIEGEVEDGEIVEDEEEEEPPAVTEDEVYEGLHGVMPDNSDPEVEDETPVDEAPAADAQVWVAWPDAEASLDLKVGPATRWGELVANYLNANPEVDFLARYVVTDAEGNTYDQKATIGPESYGSEFFLEAEVALKSKEEA